MKKIPTIKEIFERFEDNIKAQLDIPANEELKENLAALGMVISAEMKLLYLYLQDIQRNVYPTTADYERFGGQLNRLGMIYLNRPPHPATSGIYNISVNGTVGSVIPQGTTFKSNLNSESTFVLDDDYILINGQNTITVRSVGLGSDNYLPIGESLYYTSPIIGVENNFIVTQEIQTPTNEEPEDVYRKAIIDAIQIEPQGGSRGDYLLWAKDAPGVRRVYPYVESNNLGTVNVYVEANAEDSTDGRGTPSTGMLNNVTSVLNLDPDTSKPIEERARRPIQAQLNVLPIVVNLLDIVVHDLYIDTSSERNSIESGLEQYVKDLRPFIYGAELNRDKNDLLNKAKISNVITEAISSDNYFQDIQIFLNGNSIDNYFFENGNIPFVNSVSYV